MGRYVIIKQIILVQDYWKVIVYYNIDYNFFNIILYNLRELGASYRIINKMWEELYYEKAKAVTFSSFDNKTSLILFNCHKNKIDYINSIVHEIEHVKQAMLEFYNVEDSGESPAYTVGYLMGNMYKVFKFF